MKIFLTKTPVVITFALICCALWGSAFPCIKIGYRMFAIGGNDTASQILFAGIRFLLAGLMVILICSFIYKKPLIPHSGATIKRIFILSLFQTILQYVFFYVGLANTTGSKAAIIEAANVFLAILVSGLLFKMEKVTSKKMLGCLIGFIGVVIINLGNGVDAHFSLTGEGFHPVINSGLCFLFVIIKYFSVKEKPCSAQWLAILCRRLRDDPLRSGRRRTYRGRLCSCCPTSALYGVHLGLCLYIMEPAVSTQSGIKNCRLWFLESGLWRTAISPASA